MNTKDTAAREAAVAALKAKYGFKPYEEIHPRVIKRKCPATKHTATNLRCLCDGNGFYKERISWVNADEILIAEIPAGTAMLCRYGMVNREWAFWSVDIYLSGFTVNPHLQVRGVKGELHATTDDWNGEQAGSAIRRKPDSLRGFMWRTDDEKGDHHVLPDDIIQYMLAHSKPE
jgi:hypothetical protein